MGWRLTVVEGADKGHSFPLHDEGTTTIGSIRKSVDIYLHDLTVARVHCQLEAGDGRVVLRPTDPRFPVLLDGEPIEECVLLRGQTFRVGNSTLRLDTGGSGVMARLGAEGKQEADSEVVSARKEPGTPNGDTAPPTPAPPTKSPSGLRPAVAATPLPPTKGAAAVPQGPALPALPPERLEELSGHTLNHYEIGPVLGSGPTGVIFRANDLKTRITVALRIISPELTNEQEMQPFVRTLRVVLPLRHRNLVSMWNAGRTGAYCWLAVDYVEGETLRQLLKEQEAPTRFAWKHAVQIGVHVARALNYVHRQKLAHGNVTPSNILLRDADKVVKLGDLMLSKALEGSALGRYVRSQTLKNELPYYAPEQAGPQPRTDALTDIYGLGACMYARCTGQPPFQGATLEEVVEQIHHGPLARPRQWQQGIPDAVDDAVGRMLARRREDRYQSAADVLADLESIAEAEGVEV